MTQAFLVLQLNSYSRKQLQNTLLISFELPGASVPEATADRSVWLTCFSHRPSPRLTSKPRQALTQEIQSPSAPPAQNPMPFDSPKILFPFAQSKQSKGMPPTLE